MNNFEVPIEEQIPMEEPYRKGLSDRDTVKKEPVNWEERYKELLVVHISQKMIIVYLIGLFAGFVIGSLKRGN